MIYNPFIHLGISKRFLQKFWAIWEYPNASCKSFKPFGNIQTLPAKVLSHLGISKCFLQKFWAIWEYPNASCKSFKSFGNIQMLCDKISRRLGISKWVVWKFLGVWEYPNGLKCLTKKEEQSLLYLIINIQNKPISLKLLFYKLYPCHLASVQSNFYKIDTAFNSCYI